MHIAESTCTNGQYFVVIRKTRGVFDVLACVLSNYCRHEHGRRDRCILTPPRWTYWVGGHYRYSLGGALWGLGQWIARREGELVTLAQYETTRAELELRFGWLPDLED